MYCSVLVIREWTPVKKSSSRSFQEKGAAPTELDQEVAKAIFDIEVSPSCDIKAELKDVYISGAKDVEVGKAGMAMVVHFPSVFGRLWRRSRAVWSESWRRSSIASMSSWWPTGPFWTRTSGARAWRCDHAAALWQLCTSPSWRIWWALLRLLASAPASLWMEASWWRSSLILRTRTRRTLRASCLHSQQSTRSLPTRRPSSCSPRSEMSKLCRTFVAAEC